MPQFIDLTGQRFAKWTVIDRSPRDYVTPDHRHYVLWRCKCECGTEADVLASHLRSRASGRCRKCKYQQTKLMGRMPAHVFHRISYGAALRGISVSPVLTREWLRELYESQNGLCAISGLPIGFPETSVARRRGDVTASLDRIDSDRGYEPDNVQWVHKDINRMKADLPAERFLELCSVIAEHNTWRRKMKLEVA